MKKRIVGIFMTLAVILGMLCPALPVQAADRFIPEEITATYYPPTGNDFAMDNRYWLPTDCKVLVNKCTSSDKSVAVVEETEDYGGQVAEPYINIKKPGTATLKIVLKRNGVKKSYKVKFTAVKYKNPLASFKIGSKDYTKKYNKTTYYGIRGKKTVKGKLKVTVKKGYKIKKIKAVIVEHNNWQRSFHTEKVENGQKLTLPYESLVTVVIQNRKTKEKIEIRFEPGYAF